MQIRKTKDSEDIAINTWYFKTIPAGVTVWPSVVGNSKGHRQIRRTNISHFVAIHLIANGSGTFFSSSGEYTIRTGDMFACWPGVFHDFCDHPNDPWELFWARLDGPGSLDLGIQWGFGADRPVLYPLHRNLAIQHFRTLYKYWGRRKRDPYEGLAHFNNLIAASRHPQPSITSNFSTSVNIVQEARMIIDTILETGVSVEELADRLNVSRATLWRMFIEETGMSITDWISDARIKRAKTLLRDTKFKMSVIARMCGFNDEKYFLRAFRKAVGTTPGKWRYHALLYLKGLNK